MFTRIVCFVVDKLWFHPWVQGPFSLLWQAIISFCLITPFVFNILGVKYLGKANLNFGFLLLGSFFGGIFFFIVFIVILLRIARYIARRKFFQIFGIEYRPPFFKEGERQRILPYIYGELQKRALIVHQSPQNILLSDLRKFKENFRLAYLVASTVYGNHGCSEKIRDYVWSYVRQNNNKFEEEEDTGWVVVYRDF